MNKPSQLLVALQQEPDFRQAMAEVRHLRPQIPDYEPAQTADEEQQQMNVIRHSSGMQKGFDLLWTALMGSKP